MSTYETPVRIGVYVCHCGTNIAGFLDVEALAAFARTLPGVVVARDYKYMCSDPGQELIKQDIQEYRLNRVVVAACSPNLHETTFRNAAEAAGMNRFLVQIANIREQVSWVAEDREDTGAPPGQIVAQRPLAGSKLHAGEAVNVTVARPPVLVKVPNVVGQLIGEAKIRLEKARLTISNTVEQTHPTLGVGMVISQSVPEGAEVRAGSGLELKVSKGADSITVPAVTGKSLSRAKEILTQAGLVAGQVRYGSNDDRSPGVVLDQKPAANTAVAKGSAVDLVVNSD